MVSLSAGGRSFKRYVHDLVVEAFISPRPYGMEVNHKDRNRLNPAAENLEWVTRADNIAHMYESGYQAPCGEQKRTHKLTWADVEAIRASSETHRALGERYGVSHGTIGNIKRGTDWARRPEIERVLA